MPSVEHEVLVELLREHPDLVLELLRAAFGRDYDGTIEVASSTENLTEIHPPERRADLVLVLRAPGAPAASRAVVVEVQLRPDPRKRWAWPVYVTVLRARLLCPVSLVVITLDDATARWCALPIELGDEGSTLRPCVIGPALVPIVDGEVARRHPELGLLSLLAHRTEPIAFELARSLLVALDDVDEVRARWYADVVFGFVGEAVRRALEAEMNPEKYEFRSEFMRRLVAEGEARGEARGELVALGGALLKVLEARGLPVSDDQRALVMACSDRAQLDEWLARAVHVVDVAELFDSPD